MKGNLTIQLQGICYEDTELKKKIERSYQLLDEYNELAKSAEFRDITIKDIKDVPLLAKLHIIEFLINQGIDINWVNHYGETALCIALYEHQTEIAELLINHGAI